MNKATYSRADVNTGPVYFHSRVRVKTLSKEEAAESIGNPYDPEATYSRADANTPFVFTPGFESLARVTSVPH